MKKWYKRMFNTRLGRLNFFLGSIFSLVSLGLLFFLFYSLLFGSNPKGQTEYGRYVLIDKLISSGGPTFYLIYLVALFFIIFLFLIFISLSVTIRRLHDLGFGFFMYLLLSIPLINFVISLLLLFKEGNQGKNIYGEPSIGGIKEIFIPTIDSTSVSNFNSQFKSANTVPIIDPPKPPISNTPSNPNISIPSVKIKTVTIDNPTGKL